MTTFQLAANATAIQMTMNKLARAAVRRLRSAIIVAPQT
jgi:hypothetical protein